MRGLPGADWRVAAVRLLSPDAAMVRQASMAARVRAPARAPGRRAMLGIAGGLAAAAAAFLIVWGLADGGPRETAEIRTKGSLALTVHVKRAAGPAGASGPVDEVNAEGRLRAGDEIRFTLLAARPGYAVVLGLDAAPSVTVYAPSPSVARSARVESAGMSRCPAACWPTIRPASNGSSPSFCDTETPPETLRRQAVTALALASGRPERVTSLGTGCLETSVSVQERAAMIRRLRWVVAGAAF